MALSQWVNMPCSKILFSAPGRSGRYSRNTASDNGSASKGCIRRRSAWPFASGMSAWETNPSLAIASRKTPTASVSGVYGTRCGRLRHSAPKRVGAGVEWGRGEKLHCLIDNISPKRVGAGVEWRREGTLASPILGVYNLSLTRDIMVYIMISHVRKDIEAAAIRPNKSPPTIYTPPYL